MPFRSTPSDPLSRGWGLVLAALTPRAIERTEARIREVVEHFALPLRRRRDVVDLMGEFASPVSAAVIGRILGVPPKGDDDLRFRMLAHRAKKRIWVWHIRSEKQRRETETASVELAEYVLGLVEERRQTPGEDMISDLVRASGPATDASNEDIVRTIGALIAAGTGVPGVGCARALRALLLHPAQLSLLRSERSLLANAVDELLRYDSAVAFTRFAIDSSRSTGFTSIDEHDLRAREHRWSNRRRARVGAPAHHGLPRPRPDRRRS
jgi:unspecific monooxygenase